MMLVLLALFAAGPAPLHQVRDVRPLVVARGDKLVVEGYAFVAGATTEVAFELPGFGTARVAGRATGRDRVLVDVDAAFERAFHGAPPRAAARVSVTQSVRGQAIEHGPGPVAFPLEIFPHDLRAVAHGLVVDGAGPLGLPPGVVAAALLILVALGVVALLGPVAGFIVVWERKVAGRMQSRLGPNRVGPDGWLQWLADAIKLITKEDIVPTEADRRMFTIAPYFAYIGIVLTFIVLPLAPRIIVADLDIGLLFLGSVTSLVVVSILMGGWASNSKWSLLGGMRSAAQIISYELPASVALLNVAVMTGSLSTQSVIAAQGGVPWHWNLFKTPFGFICFFIYFISALAEGNRTPFDLPEAESELVSGYNTEYSGFRFGIFPMVEWINLYVVSAVATTAFLGGWRLPGVRLEAIEASTLLTLLAAAVFLAKVVALVFVIIWIRWSLPRFRVDQMMALCWKYFLPISLACFLGVTAWLWLVPVAVQEVAGILTFLVCGICLGAYFASRVRFAYRSTPRPAGGTP